MDKKKELLNADIENLFDVYLNWISNFRKLDKEIISRYQNKILETYDTVYFFFQSWMENTSKNRHKFLKLLSELLKLTQ